MKRGKRAQVSVFIILAIAIVALAILIYLFYPSIEMSLGIGAKNPSEFIQTCLEDKIKDTITEISLQGGSLKPEHYFLYNGSNIEYLCYVESYYLPCVVQQPMLKQHIESEILKGIEEQSKECLDSLESKYKKAGYSASISEGNTSVELLPKRIAVTFNNKIILAKENTETYDKISIIINNNLYERIGIANSIIEWETRLGEAETTLYMNYYHDLKVEKKKQSDGTKIYIITDRNTGDIFQLASRSIVWPSGYGMEGTY